MVKRIGSRHRKTRHKFKLYYREQGKIPLSKYFQDFKDGDFVSLVIQANVQKGRFYRRFYGMSGIVTGKKGSCYEVTIQDGHKEKKLYVHPVHLNIQKNTANHD